jgi:hypothetical protein
VVFGNTILKIVPDFSNQFQARPKFTKKFKFEHIIFSSSSNALAGNREKPVCSKILVIPIE